MAALLWIARCLLFKHHLVKGDNRVNKLSNGQPSGSRLFSLSAPDQPPVEEKYEGGEHLDAGADADVLVPEHLDVIDQTATTLGALACLLPEETRGVDDIAKDDWARDVAKDAKYDKLDAQGKGLFLLLHTSEHDHEHWHLSDGNAEGHAEEENHEGEHHLALGVAWSRSRHGDPSHPGVEGGGSARKNTGTVGVVVTVWE